MIFRLCCLNDCVQVYGSMSTVSAGGPDSKLKVLVIGYSHVYWLDRFSHTDRPNWPAMHRDLAPGVMPTGRESVRREPIGRVSA